MQYVDNDCLYAGYIQTFVTTPSLIKSQIKIANGNFVVKTDNTLWKEKILKMHI